MSMRPPRGPALPLPEATSGVNKLTIFHTGGLMVSSKHLCSSLPSRRAFHPVSCCLIEHPVQGPVLFDTGLGSFSSQVLRLRPVRLIARLARIVFADHYQLLNRLDECGIDGGDIGHAILSHLHFDHTGGMRDLPNADFYVTRAEWAFAQEQHGLRGLMKGYMRDDYANTPWSFIAPDDSLDVWPFDWASDLFGDGSIILVSTPGHTPGHVSALVTLASGRRVFLAADAALVRQNYTLPADQGAVTRGLRWDHGETWRTMLKLRSFWKRHPEIEIFTTHDGRLGRQLKRGPLTLE